MTGTGVDRSPLSTSSYPNPVDRSVTIRYTLPGGANEGMLHVFDAAGRAISTARLDGRGMIELDTSKLSNGTYAYVIESAKGSTAAMKLIVAH